MDVSVKSPEQLRTASGAPNLGTIAFDAQVPKRPLIVHEDPHSPRSEAFRQLRTNLQFVDVDKPPQGDRRDQLDAERGQDHHDREPGDRACLGGSRVLLVETCAGQDSLLLGLERTVGLTSVLSGAGVQQAIQPWGGVSTSWPAAAAAEPE